MTEKTALELWQEQSEEAAGALFTEALTGGAEAYRQAAARIDRRLIYGTAPRAIYDRLQELNEADEINVVALQELRTEYAPMISVRSLTGIITDLKAAAAAGLTEQEKQAISEAKDPDTIREIVHDFDRARGILTLQEETAAAVTLDLETFLENQKDPISTNRKTTRNDGRGDFTGFDKITGGMTPRRVYTVIGESSIGKSAFALTLAENAARNGAHALYFTVEMDKYELISRSISGESYTVAYQVGRKNAALTAANIYDEKLKNADMDIYQTAAARFYEYAGNLWIYEAARKNARDIARDIANHRNKYPDAQIAVFIDYLQIIPSDDPRKTDKQAADDKMRLLKNAAVENGAAMLILSSTRREEYGGEKGMDAAKESGGIEYGTDMLAILDRPHRGQTEKGKWIETETLEQWKNKPVRDLTFTVLKQRGRQATGWAGFLFDPAHNFIKDMPKGYAKDAERMDAIITELDENPTGWAGF